MVYGDVAGKVAVITGGAGGMGRATARKLLGLGARVMLVDLSEEALRDAVTDLGSEDVSFVAANVTKEDDVKAYVRAAVEAHGRIDIFYQAAGVEGRIKPLVEYEFADFTSVFEINVFGTFLGLRHVLPVMYAQSAGSVVLTGSISGLDENSRGTAGYDSSKAAIVGLTQTAALESSDHGVRINAIHPGPVNTALMKSIHNQRHPGTDPANSRERLAGIIPLGRVGTADEIASLVTFLASDESSFITGANYRIDGGLGSVGRLTRPRGSVSN